MVDGTPRNVPPLITAAVRATATAPIERFPRKYFFRKSALLVATRLATTPSPSEIRVNSRRAITGPQWPWRGSSVMRHPFADLALQVGGVVAAEVVLAHHETDEPGGEQPADAPREDYPPEEPR